jgi:hypothetical protein
MYVGVLQRTWPLLLALPIVWKRLRSDALDPLGWFAVSLALLYGVGAWLNNGPVGRVLPGLILTLHLALAAECAALEQRWASRGSSRRSLAFQLGIALVCAVGLANMSAGLIRAVPRAVLPQTLANDPRLDQPGGLYASLRGVIGPDDVVLADLNFSRHLPAITGRVVGFIDPEAFIPDEQQRREAVTRFFAPASPDERRRLIDHYDVRFIAVDQRTAAMTRELRKELESLGPVVHDDGRLLVIELTPS